MKLRDAAATTVVARSDRVWVVKLSNERYFDNTSSLRLARRFSSRDDAMAWARRWPSAKVVAVRVKPTISVRALLATEDALGAIAKLCGDEWWDRPANVVRGVELLLAKLANEKAVAERERDEARAKFNDLIHDHYERLVADYGGQVAFRMMDVIAQARRVAQAGQWANTTSRNRHAVGGDAWEADKAVRTEAVKLAELIWGG